MASNAIEVRGLSKRYRLGQQQAAYGSLRDSLASSLRRDGRRRSRDEIWALRDVDLTVTEGEAVGIIGTNGSGKTTLLRILARITEPSEGVARTRGRVGVMLEVGTGFHPELTGRENVYLSGAVMGMRRREIRRVYDDIVEFSGVERFIETPLKRYSSGMQLRLAFAVAAHLEPDLMLVDEILAVGDVAFQRRCLERMDRFSREGRTVIFVSHDLGAVSRLCSRAYWVNKGRIVTDGPAAKVVDQYYDSQPGAGSEGRFDVEGDAGISHAALVDERGAVVQQVRRGEPVTVQVRLVVRRPVPPLDLAIAVNSSRGAVVMEMWSDQAGIPELTSGVGEYLVRMRLEGILRPGDYVVTGWLGGGGVTHVEAELFRFTVVPLPSDRQEQMYRRRMVEPPVTWTREPVAEVETEVR
jgi:ABC-2 type transport system ATP-binding protein/lipopolysaccharide transport system ATP-binding protein